MKGGTLFSGIGAPEAAMPWVDWRWCAEIEKAPSAIHAARFPNAPNLGDVTKVDWDAVEPVDFLVAGSPCQSFSVAGKRLGLDDPRGNLALVTLAVARQLRVQWVAFENVPGLLSSDDGKDFGAFLALMGECGFGWAYRVLDARYFGVPQRRRRVFVVGYLGDWRRAAAVLFEQESLSWDFKKGRKAGEGSPASTPPGPHRLAGNDNESLARCDTTGEGRRQDGESCTFIAHTLRGEGFDASEDGTGRGTPLVAVAGTLQSSGRAAGSATQQDAHSGLLVPTAFGWQNSPSQSMAVDDITPTLDKSKTPAVAFSHLMGAKAGGIGYAEEESTTVGTRLGGGAVLKPDTAVRRLTPRECERLQGFPDDWTHVPFPKKLMADGPRYKAIGNSMAVPVLKWIGDRIQAVDALDISKAA